MITAHLRTCARCATELEMLKEFQSGERCQPPEGDAAWVANRLREKRGDLLATATRPVPAKQGAPRWNRASWLTLPRLSFASATLVLLVSAGLYLRQNMPSDAGVAFSESGAFRTARVGGVQPSGDVAEIPARISWDPVPTARTYQVRLKEVDGNEVWNATVKSSFVALPRQATVHISFTKTLLIEVAAFDQAGRQIAISEATRFRLMARGK